MVISSLPPSHYYQRDIYDLELKNVFQKSWVFVGLSDALTSHNDFISGEIGGIPYLVQNFHGELRAYHNVCSHRHNIIHAEPKGNAKLRCIYHNWVYNDDGVPVGIYANEANFGFDREQKACLRLRRFELAACGRFLFLRIAPGGETLEQFLGEFHGALTALSEDFDSCFEELELLWDANWKIGMDNAAEGYHVPTIHSDTFQPVFANLDLGIRHSAHHSAYRGELSQTASRWYDRVQGILGLTPSRSFQGYDNFLIFPNMVVTLVAGTFLTVQDFVPQGPDQVRLRTRSLLCRAGSGRAQGPARRQTEEHLAAMSARIRDEDRVICERVHRGTRSASRPAVLGTSEGRIQHFNAAYRQFMEQDLDR